MSADMALITLCSAGGRYLVSRASCCQNIPWQGVAVYNGVEMAVNVLVLRYLRRSDTDYSPLPVIASRVIGVGAGMAATAVMGISAPKHAIRSMAINSTSIALALGSLFHLFVSDRAPNWFLP